MGTSNFYYTNASKVFAVCMNREVPVLDDEGNETGETTTEAPERWEIQDTIDNIREQMKGDKYTYYKDEGWDSSAPRSYPCMNIGRWCVSKEYAGVEIYLTLRASLNSAYYEGACLDWEFDIQVNGSEVDEVDAEDISYYGTVNSGLAKRIAGYANNWVSKTKEQMVNNLEKIFEEMSEIKLKRVATFSNGETIYEAA